jgi:ABC-type phosphate/phosphonate transport system substrate-binding protein
VSLASLPMYDRPETAAANDRFWQAIRNRLGEGPDTLTRTGELWDHWLSPDLLLSQTCGYPYRAKLHGKVTLVGTPDYGLPGCPPGHYRSVFVARTDDPRATPANFAEAPFAYNEPLSQSGWAAPQNHAAAHGFTFTNTIQTGGHVLSARAVAEGKADIAALDALTWALIQRHDPFATTLREIARTEPTPVLPYITALSRDPEPLFDAISAAIADLSPDDRDTLSLRGLVRIPPDAYLAIPNPPPPG